MLAENRSPAESLFLAQVARQRGDLIRSRAALDELDVDALAADLLLERGLIAWKAGDLETMRKDLAAYPAAGPRSAEARYHLGLALFHLGDPESARATWADLVETFGENRWSYRADWAWSQTTDDGIAKQKRSFTTMGAKSLLGRHGYMGRQNPDLVMDPGLDESAQ